MLSNNNINNNNFNDDGVVVTVYFHGTCSNSEDYKNPLYTDQGDIVGETVATLRKNTQGREVIDFLNSKDSPDGIKHFYIGVDGVGSGNKDHSSRLVPPTKYSEPMQIAFGYGVDENINHVLEALRQLIARGVKIKSVVFHGWSRGAGSCVTCSTRMEKDEVLRRIPVYMVCFEPVPGYGNVSKENLYLSANVKHAVIIIAEHERSSGFGAVIPMPKNHETLVQYLISPGSHATVTYNTGWRYESTAHKYPNVSIYFPQPGKIFRWMAVNFMMRYGTQFNESFIQSLVSKDQLVPLFNAIAEDLKNGLYDYLSQEYYTVPQQFGSSRKVSHGDHYTNLVLSQIEVLHDQRKIKRKDNHVNSFHTFLLSHPGVEPTEFFNPERKALLTFELEDFFKSPADLESIANQQELSQQELSEDIKLLQNELVHTNSEDLNGSGLNDDAEKQLIIEHCGEECYQRIEEQLRSRCGNEVAILAPEKDDNGNTPIELILEEQRTLSTESNIGPTSFNETDLKTEQNGLQPELIENSLTHSQTGQVQIKNNEVDTSVDVNPPAKQEEEHEVTLISHEILQPDDLENKTKRDIIDFLIDNQEFFLFVYQDQKRLIEFLKSELGKKHKNDLRYFSQRFLEAAEGKRNLLNDLYMNLCLQDQEIKLSDYLKKNISIQAFLAKNLKRLEAPIADWKIWQEASTNKNQNKNKKETTPLMQKVRNEKVHDDLSERDIMITSRLKTNGTPQRDRVKQKPVDFPPNVPNQNPWRAFPNNSTPKQRHVLFVCHPMVTNELINALDNYMLKRWNEALPKGQITKSNLTLKELEKNRARFSNHYTNFLARFFGGHNAYVKISAALKVRTILELQDQLNPNLLSKIGEVASSFTANEIEALRASKLGALMNKNKRLWPDELNEIIQKKERSAWLQLKSSK